MTQILALQQLDLEQEAIAFPCFSVSWSTMDVEAE